MDTEQKPEDLTVARLFELLGEKLSLVAVNGTTGHDSMIESPDVSRPGMALTGFLNKFLYKRIQIFGETEITYLDLLSKPERKSSIEKIFQFPIHCSIITKDMLPPPILVELSRKNNSALFRSTRDTTPLIHDLTEYLDLVFAPRTDVYGSLVEVFGAGLLCTGRSAIGKSEAVLGLLERGHRLIADDRVYVRRIGNTLFGTGDSRIAHHMEIRGLGFVDVSSFYGIRAIKDRQQIDLEAKLMEWSKDDQDFDRTGLVQKMSRILDLSIPRTTIPVMPGRNITLLLEVAVMNFLLRRKGRSVPEEIEKNQIETIIRKEMEFKSK